MNDSNISYWSLIDHPKSKGAIVDASDLDLYYTPWYQHTPLEDIVETSPVLIKLPSHEHPMIEQHPSAIILATSVSDVEFEEFMRSRIFMRGPNGQLYLIRFYSHDYLTQWLSSLSRERAHALWGPVFQVEWTIKGSTHRWSREQNIPSPSPTKDWFQLESTDWELFRTTYKQNR